MCRFYNLYKLNRWNKQKIAKIADKVRRKRFAIYIELYIRLIIVKIFIDFTENLFYSLSRFFIVFLNLRMFDVCIPRYKCLNEIFFIRPIFFQSFFAYYNISNYKSFSFRVDFIILFSFKPAFKICR